jgi:hypothetical protein
MPCFRSPVVRTMFFVLMLLASVAACDSAADALPTALPGTGEAASTGSPGLGADGSPLPSGAITDPNEAWPAFAACLRSNGMQIADPELDANGDPHWTGDLKPRLTNAIAQACNPIIVGITESGTGRRQPRTYSFDSLLANAACMREHGLPDYPDPIPNAANQGLADGYDKGNQTVLAALIACEDTLVETTPSASPAQ